MHDAVSTTLGRSAAVADAFIVGMGARKGGVGKTVTTYHTARAAARAGRRVLLVDIDPQGSLTTLTAFDDGEPLAKDSIGVADLLLGEATLPEILTPTLWHGVDLAPTVGTALELMRTELAIAARADHEKTCTLLRNALQSVAADYDLIFIDMPPAIDLLTINALTASHAVALVTEAKLLSVEQIGEYRTTMDTVTSTYNPDLRLLGAVISRFEGETNTAKEWAIRIEEAVPVLATIPKRAAINDSTEFSVGLDSWPGGAVSAELSELYDELLASIERSRS